jgi:O-antigen/teichoic acid export membrane protein
MINFIKRKYINLTSDTRFSEILTGSAWALGARVIATGVGVITSIIIARFYGAEMMGIVAVLNSFLMLATIFTVLGTDTSILRLIPEHLAKYSPTSAFKVYRKTQYFVAGVSVITGSLLFLGSGFVAEKIFSKPHLRYYFALGAIFIVFKALVDLNTQAVRGVRLIRTFAFMQLLPTLSKLMILVPVTIFFYHQDNPIYAMFASIAITALAGAWIMDRVFKQKSAPDDTLHPMPMKEVLTISLPMLMSGAMGIIIGQIGIIMLGIFRPEEEVGYYSVATKLATLTTFVLAAINSMAAPKFSQLYHSGRMEELFHIAKKATKLIFWTTTPMLFLLVLMGNPLIEMLFGSKFKAAYWAMVCLIVGQFVNSISGPTGYFMNMTGNQNTFRNIVFIATLINVGLNLLLIPRFGIFGAAVASTICIISWNIATLCFIKFKYKETIGYIPIFYN